jgi:hypothetical protein
MPYTGSPLRPPVAQRLLLDTTSHVVERGVGPAHGPPQRKPLGPCRGATSLSCVTHFGIDSRPSAVVARQATGVSRRGCRGGVTACPSCHLRAITERHGMDLVVPGGLWIIV